MRSNFWQKQSFKLAVFFGVLSVASALHARDRDDVEGNYSVPVSAELEASADYPVNYRFEKEGGRITEIRYALPETLVGDNVDRIRVRPAPTAEIPNRWAGDTAEGTCTQQNTYMECELNYRNLNIDTNAAIRNVESIFASDPAEIARRITVLRAFGSEPRGILRFEAN